jgi:hypothetical protein
MLMKKWQHRAFSLLNSLKMLEEKVYLYFADGYYCFKMSHHSSLKL